ncbi:MAG: Hsp20/alpha crystallin family protein [Gemmatimonadota bacterium]|nr:Hsp20/alpha crystallin family protein [Gemmatimonadota bacterium]
MTDRARKRGPVEELLDDVESYVEELFQSNLPLAYHGRVRWTPPTDVYECEEEFCVVMAVPGLRKDEVKVEFEGQTLRVRGMRREPAGQKRHYYKMEIPVGPFERRVRIGRAIRADDIRVRYEDGLLRISLPKARSGPVEVPID